MIAEAVVQVHRVTKNVSQVTEETGEIVGIGHKSPINGALLNKLCTTKSLRSRSRL